MRAKCVVCQRKITDKRRECFCSDACVTVFAQQIAENLDRSGDDT